MNYKKTLNLPKTNFSMKANLTHMEPNMLCYWENMNTYANLREARKDKDKYVLHDGPPYANGLIHIGHALNKILKDIIVKYKFLRGYDCPFMVGWDCHGLPVEHQLFKELKLTKHDVDVVDFRKNAKEFALKFVGLQTKDFKRLGVFSDWNNPYLTLNSEYEYGVIKLLEYLVEQGYVYRGRKPVNWCARCETALAEAEVEYLDKESDSIYFLFDVIGPKNSLPVDKKIYFLVWTTTPWTLISNVAVAVHPSLEYCLAEHNGKKIVLCRDLLPLLTEKFGPGFTVEKTFQGEELEGIMLKHPFLDREAPVVLADFVSKEDGSGCVHIAPGHGDEDFSLTRKYNLPIIMPVNDKGIFEEPDIFQGMNVNRAGEKVIELLNEKSMLVKAEKITHSYPHCWRCKKAIIFRATFQWFVNVDHKNLRDKLLKEIEKVRWVPFSGKERMRAMLVQRPDWCLSRQRLWGIPIPAVKCESCQKVSLNSSVIRRVADIFRQKGSDSWFSDDIKDFLPGGFSCDECGAKDFSKEFDILDVWFESGASFLSVVKNDPQLAFPADLYLEGSDQHRGWFQVSLIPSVAKENISPFKTILTHGFVVDAEGRKMSKSLGNVIAPQEIINKYGAEILRLWAAYTDYSEDVKISENIIKQLVDVYRKVRNTIRFILGNINDFDLNSHSPVYEELLEVDRFMLSKAMLLMDEVIADYEEFSFYKACQKVFNFCNLDLSSFYLDILKDRLYTFSPNSRERRSAQFVLYQIVKVILRLIAPIMSFTAEEANSSWEGFNDSRNTIFISTFDEVYNSQWLDKDLLQRWERILNLRDTVYKELEKYREKGLIGSSLEAEITLKFKGQEHAFYSGCREALREVFIVSDVNIDDGDSAVLVEKASGQKCPRCWNWKKDIGNDKDFPEVCSRCAQALRELEQ